MNKITGKPPMSMKILCVGDLHGKPCWKDVNPDDHDRIVFLGDYTDSPTIDGEAIVQNLGEIIAFKRRFPEKVVLLLGNHDIVYSEYPEFESSGFMKRHQPALTALFESNKQLFQVAWQYGNHLFTHAGVTNGFMQENIGSVPKGLSLADYFNQIHTGTNRRILHRVSRLRGGLYRWGGITWADMEETKENFLDGYHQVVGHTRVPSFFTCVKPEASITYTDVLEAQTQFYSLEIAI